MASARVRSRRSNDSAIFDCPRQHIAAASARLDHLITGGKVKVAAKLLFRVASDAVVSKCECSGRHRISIDPLSRRNGCQAPLHQPNCRNAAEVLAQACRPTRPLLSR